MSFLGVIEAVRWRLEGHTPRSCPELHPFLRGEQQGTSAKLDGTAAQVETHLHREGSFLLASRRVPVFFPDAAGKESSRLYPSVTFDVIDISPRNAENLFSHGDYRPEWYSIPVTTSNADVYLDGTLVEADRERMVQVRPLELAVDFLVEVRVYAEETFMSALLVGHIFRVLPNRHFIRVPVSDGTYRSWDLEFKSYADLDKREAVLDGQPGARREHCKVFTYRVEGYLDNLELARYENLIRTRTLNMEVT